MGLTILLTVICLNSRQKITHPPGKRLLGEEGLFEDLWDDRKLVLPAVPRLNPSVLDESFTWDRPDRESSKEG